MKKLLKGIGLFVLAFMLQSHEFWLQPNKFLLDIGDTFSLDIRVGESYQGELWNYRDERIVGFHQYDSKGRKDLTKKANKGEGNNLQMKFDMPGLQLLALESNSAFIELEGEKFNAYLIEDGLDDALKYRKENGLLDKKSSEFYARNVKCLIKVGDVDDDTYKTIVGMPIEVVPLKNPYAIKGKQDIDFEVRYHDKPLKKALVKLWHKTKEGTTMKEFRTDDKGTVRVAIKDSGIWMVSVVQMVPSERENADWQSYWGSLTFGFE